MTIRPRRIAVPDADLSTDIEAGLDPGSFRDRYSRVCADNGKVFRLLSPEAEDAWKALSNSSLYENTTQDGRLIPARIVSREDLRTRCPGHWSAVLEHPRIPFISYPYEWTFGMLKDAALLQLTLLRDALREDMTSKDATPYNIQWYGSRPIFIDIPSLEPLAEGSPWSGYRQFCELFLFPLMLQAYKGLPFQPWLRGSLEGMSAEQMLSLFTLRDWLRPGVFPHVVLQARFQDRYAGQDRDVRGDLRRAGFSKVLIQRNVDNLIRLIGRLSWGQTRSEWSDYGNSNSYTATELGEKTEFVKTALARQPRRLVWDVGCNRGHFSRIAAEHSECVLALDADPLVVDRLYGDLKRTGEERILPLYVNVADPSPGLGWRNRERRELSERGRPDFILALAVIHHMVIGANIPLDECLSWFAGFGGELLIEFVDRSDPMVVRLLRNRDDIFWDYTREHFEEALSLRFDILNSRMLKDGHRTLYHAKCRAPAGG